MLSRWLKSFMRCSILAQTQQRHTQMITSNAQSLSTEPMASSLYLPNPASAEMQVGSKIQNIIALQLQSGSPNESHLAGPVEGNSTDHSRKPAKNLSNDCDGQQIKEYKNTWAQEEFPQNHLMITVQNHQLFCLA